MRNLDMIQASIDDIECSLKTDMTAQELVDKANFSLFHYYRVFRKVVGMPVMQYITRRKLLHAMYEICCGSKIIDVALAYGFDTYAGFYKSLKREFGYSPKQFLKDNKVSVPYRINLLQEEYRMINHQKLREVLSHWGLENETVRDIFYDSGERNDHAWYVGERYVIKAFANLDALNNNRNVSKSLAQLGVSSPALIQTVNGKEMVEEGQLYFVVTKRLAGKPMKALAMYEDDYQEKARFVGEIIGHLSLALAKVDAMVNEAQLYDNVKNWALPKVKDLLNIPEGFWKNMMEAFGSLYHTLPKQIIHRDLNPSNIVMAEDSWGVIDFELAERNIRIFDPCYAATGILSESFDESDQERLAQWMEIYQNIIYGYDSVVRLSPNEIKAIPYVLIFHQLICCAWFSEQEKYANVFQTNKKMTEWLCKHFDRLIIAP